MALHAFLQPAKEAAVEDAKGTPFVDETGNIVAPPTTAQLLMWFQGYQQQADAVMGQLNQAITEQSSTITLLYELLNGKASADSLAAVRQRVTQTESMLLDKADTAFVAQQVQTIAGIDAQQAAALTAFQQALISEDGIVQGLLSAQTNLTNLVSGLRSDVDLKAPAATVSALSGQVTTVRNTVNDPTTGLAALNTTLGLKANLTDVATLASTVATKATTADLTALQTTVQGIPATITQAKQDVKTELLGGAGSAYDTLQELATLDLNTSNLAQQLAVRVGSVEGIVNNATTGVAALNTALGTKALASDLTATNNNVAANTAAITLRATTTSVAAVSADVQTRLMRSGDVATGSIMVPTATTAAAAPRLDQTYGGLNAPIRFATSVGATAVAMSPGPLTDPTPQGRKAKPYLVVLTMRSAPTIGSTITVGTTPTGADVFTKTYTLALLPGLNAVLAPMQPIFIELPPGTTLYAKATAGTWDVEVLSYYKS